MKYSSGKYEPVFSWALLWTLITVVLMFSRLLPLSNWMGDEYYQIGGLEELKSFSNQFWYFVRRFEWSPRPLSELCLFFYDKAVIYTHHPLAELFNVTLWVTFFGLTSAGATRTRHDAIATRLSVPLLFFLVIGMWGPSYEIMFWPAGTAPYLLTIAFALTLVLDFLDNTPANGVISVWQSWLLVGMALCSEVGMVFAAIWSGCCIFYSVWRTPQLNLAKRFLPLFIAPMVACLGVSWLSIVGRLTSEHHDHPTAPLILRIWTASKQVLYDYTYGPSFSNHRLTHHLLGNLSMEVVFCSGLTLLFTSGALTVRRPPSQLLVTAAACIVTQFVVTFISLEHYGFLADRHQGVCLFLTFLALFCLVAFGGTALTNHNSPWLNRPEFGHLTLCGCVLFLCLKFLPTYTTSLHDEQNVLQDRAFTWSHRWGQGTPIVFRCKSHTAFIPACPSGVTQGIYTRKPDMPWELEGVIRLFNENTLIVQEH